MEYGGAVHSIYSLKYSVPKEFSTLFYSGLNYDYNFIIKVSEEEFEKNYLFREKY